MLSCKAFILLTTAWCTWGATQFRSDIYPSLVPKFAVRKCDYSNSTVRSGLLHTLPSKSTLSDFRQHLQCTVREPNFNYNTGVISAFRMLPPTSQLLQKSCLYIENKCKSWNSCWKNYNESIWSNSSDFSVINQWSLATLLRVINHTLYYDWPWGIDRFTKVDNPTHRLMQMTLDRITDMGDSVFLESGDQPSIPYDVTIPMVCRSTAEHFSEIVWPWSEMFTDAVNIYNKVRTAGLNFTDDAYEAVQGQEYLPWNQKIPKAALFATLFRARQFLFDVARQHPSLFDVAFNSNGVSHERMKKNIDPWNPESSEQWNVSYIEKAFNACEVAKAQSLPPGWVLPLFNLTSIGHYMKYYPGRYKYVIVPLGYAPNVGLSTSGRMAHLLAYSGAVVLMTRSAFKFHFSAQLVPWVHYVPLSFTGADVAEKVQWLRDHDDLAQQIAENGRNFARSYLRVEDYYCYAASALEMMSALTIQTNAIPEMWTPLEVPKDFGLNPVK